MLENKQENKLPVFQLFLKCVTILQLILYYEFKSSESSFLYVWWLTILPMFSLLEFHYRLLS